MRSFDFFRAAGPLRPVLAALLVVSALAGIAPSSAQTVGPHVQSADEALAQDAGVYARRFAVPLDEAMRRLRAQGESVAVTDALQAEFADRLAGIAIDHVPDYRIVVLLTGDDPVADRQVTAGGMAVPIVFHTGAVVTRTQLIAKVSQYRGEIRAALPHAPGLGADQRTGEMVVMINGADAALDRDDALRTRFAAMTGIPVRIAVVDRATLNMSGSAGPDGADGVPVGGGARVVGTNPVDGIRYACTTGFAVTDGTRVGLVTAAHCPDTLAYVDTGGRSVPLDFVGQWGWGYQDVQVNVVAGALAPSFYADTAKTLARPVTASRGRSATRAGDFVCHRGERTGYSCAIVTMIDFAPSGDLCGGPCLAAWVAVEGPTCKGGDSGAPVFDGTTALGIVKGGTYAADGTCLFYYYMSTDYLPEGWTLLRRAPPPVAVEPAP